MKGINCLLIVDNIPVGAQVNADLRRSTSTSDVSNYITMDWEETIPRFKSWSVNCSGAYITNQEGLVALEEAYKDSKPIQVVLQSPDASFCGVGYITSFPLGAMFNDNVTYNINIQGSGPLVLS